MKKKVLITAGYYGRVVRFVIIGLTVMGTVAAVTSSSSPAIQPSLNIGDVQFEATTNSDTRSSELSNSISPSSLSSSSLVELSFRSHIKRRNTASSSNNNSSSSSSRKEAILNAIKQNNHKIIALVDKSVTLTCSIDLDDKTFSKSQDYKIIWSREIDNGKDYEPLALDDNLLVANQRIKPTRTMISNAQQNRIEWSLVISNVNPSDSSNYICQLNRKPYDIYWLKRFMLSVYEPAYFVDSRETTSEDDTTTNNNDVDKSSSSSSSADLIRSASAAAAAYENSVFVKSINEFEDFKLKCLAKGKPRPTVSWHLRYINNTLIHLNIDDNEIIIKNIRRNSKIDKVECQATNGYGATAIRSFKINIKHSPHVISKPRSYNVPTRTNEMRLNCTLVANPQATVSWLFMPRESMPGSVFESWSKNGGASVNQTKQSQVYLDARAPGDWTSISHLASYSIVNDNLKTSQSDYYGGDTKHDEYYDTAATNNVNSTTSNVSFIKMPLSKYQITEKHSGHNVISSILVIKQISQKNSGIYRCLASNELGNKTLDFKMTVLEHDYESGERQRIKNKKNPYSMERSRGNKYSGGNRNRNENGGGGENGARNNGGTSSQQDFVSDSEEYLMTGGIGSYSPPPPTSLFTPPLISIYSLCLTLSLLFLY